MAITNERSAQVTNIDAGTFQQMADVGGRVKSWYFNFTQGAAAGDADSTARLALMPAGKVRILKAVVTSSAFGAGRTVDIGYAQHSDLDSQLVVADPDFFAAGIDVVAAGTDEVTPNRAVTSKSGFALTAQVKGATIPAGATLEGFILYVSD